MVLHELTVRALGAIESVLLRRRGSFDGRCVGVGERHLGLLAEGARDKHMRDADEGRGARDKKDVASGTSAGRALMQQSAELIGCTRICQGV